METTLDIEPLLELHTGLGIVDVCDEVVDPLFKRTVHLIVSRVGFIERNRRVAGRSHYIHRIKYTASTSVQDAPYPSERTKSSQRQSPKDYFLVSEADRNEVLEKLVEPFDVTKRIGC